jgi:hypothetical protein
VERKTGLRKHFGDSGYDGRGKLTAFRSPFSLVGAHSAQSGHPPRCRSVAKMGAHQLAIQIQVAKSSKSQPYLALSHSAIHFGREPSALLTLFSVPLHLKPQTVFTSLHRTGALRTARLLASCASPHIQGV